MFQFIFVLITVTAAYGVYSALQKKFTAPEDAGHTKSLDELTKE
jgi:hypothetical protein